LAGLVLAEQARAQDDANAADIPGTDIVTWAENMHQVMGGTSLTISGSTIRGPQGFTPMCACRL